MKDKKCDIKIEFQGNTDEILKVAARHIMAALDVITSVYNVTATIDMPEKFNPLR